MTKKPQEKTQSSAVPPTPRLTSSLYRPSFWESPDVAAHISEIEKYLGELKLQHKWQRNGATELTPDNAQNVMGALIELAVCKMKGDPNKVLLQTAQVYAQSKHTHHSKYVRARSNTSLLHTANPQLATEGYLTSHNVSSPWDRSLTVSNLSMLTPTRVFSSIVQINGKTQSIAQWMIQDEKLAITPWYSYLSETELQNVIYELKKTVAAPAKVEPGLPNLLWPTSDGYIALTGLPSVRMFNTIDAVVDVPREEGYVPHSKVLIGSSKPVNISVYATHRGGWFPVLRCEPPRLHTSTQRLLSSIEQGFNQRFLGSLSQEEQRAFYSYLIYNAPNEAQNNFFDKAAKRHVRIILDKLWDYRARAEDSRKVISGASLFQKAVFHESLETHDMEELAQHVYNRVAHDTEMPKHSETMRQYYKMRLVHHIGEFLK